MRKGFTLIELLAVLVILVVIAAIATPIVMGIIDDSKESSDISTLNNMLDTAEQVYAQAYLSGELDDLIGENLLESEIFKMDNEPENGSVSFDATGNTTVVLYNNGNCYVKKPGEDITYGESTLEECTVDFVGTSTDDSGNSGSDNEDVVLTGSSIGETLDNFKDDITPLLDFGSNGGCANEVEGKNYSYSGGCYLAGAQDSNYVWFDGFLYRIMGIDSNGNIKMITEENVTAIPYHTTSSTYNNSYLESWITDYFYENLSDEAKEVMVDGAYCSDTINAAASSISRQTCSEIQIYNRVGTITLDEYNLAGGSNSYLNNDQYFWTMTLAGDEYVGFIHSNGVANSVNVAYASFGVRPIITISSDAIITGGDGSETNSYILNQATDIVTSTTLKDESTSGEYVLVNSKLYRVVSTSENGTKLIYDGTFGDNQSYLNIFSTITSDDFATSLLGSSISLVNDTTWYKGDELAYIYDFKINLESTANSYNGKVGLISVGEMLSAQSQSMEPYIYWTINSNIDASIFIVLKDGSYSWGGELSGNLGVRPVIEIVSTATIFTGNGTYASPYQIQ
ncbi:MAG: prepilin-type N-terminal cleavage/methylation domain-containing protein [Mycoplasmatota bacterium]